MKFHITLFFLISPFFGYTQSKKISNYWYLSIDTLTELRRVDTLYIKKAILTLSKDSNITKANDLFDEVYESNWKSYITYLNAGTCIKVFDNVQNKFNLNNEESFQLLIRRGVCKYIYKKYFEAIIDLNSAIKLKPSNGYSFWYRGLCKQALSDHYGAIIDFSDGLEKSDSDDNYLKINTYLNMAQSHEILKNNFAAINNYNKLIELSPSECSFYFERGKLKLIEMKKVDACLDLSKSGELGCKEAYSLIRQFCN